MKQLGEKMCVNGCGKPVHWPSKVICKDCMDRITEKLKKLIELGKEIKETWKNS